MTDVPVIGQRVRWARRYYGEVVSDVYKHPKAHMDAVRVQLHNPEQTIEALLYDLETAS